MSKLEKTVMYKIIFTDELLKLLNLFEAHADSAANPAKIKNTNAELPKFR
jgi:hypothetical protein